MRAHIVLLGFLVACGGGDDTDTDTGSDTTDTDTPGPSEGVETVTASWDVDLFSMYESPTIARFDTMDGARQLDRMVITVDHTAEIDYALRNGGPMDVSAADYSYDVYFNTIFQLGEVTDTTDDPPFFGPGSFWTGPVGVDLAAADGDDTGGLDQHSATYAEQIVFEAPYDWAETPTYMQAMIGEDEITVIVGGFSEEWFQWVNDLGPEALMFAQVDGIRYAGTLTIDYEWSLAE